MGVFTQVLVHFHCEHRSLSPFIHLFHLPSFSSPQTIVYITPQPPPHRKVNNGSKPTAISEAIPNIFPSKQLPSFLLPQRTPTMCNSHTIHYTCGCPFEQTTCKTGNSTGIKIGIKTGTKKCRVSTKSSQYSGTQCPIHAAGYSVAPPLGRITRSSHG